MTETAFYILFCLKSPNHGYGIVQKVEKLTDGAIRLAPGTHDIEFRFDPQSLRVTNTLGVSAVILIYVLCLGAFAFWVYRFVLRLNKQHPGEPEARG